MPPVIVEKDGRNDVTKQPKSGIINEGYEYESLVPAYFALELLQDPNIKTFTFEINSRSYGKFDDLIVEVLYSDNTTEKFAIQLKHREDGKQVLNATKEFFNRDSNGKCKGFNIGGYLRAYDNEEPKIQDNHKFILFTNVRFLEMDQLRFYSVLSSSSPFKTTLFNANKISQFEERSPRSSSKFYNNFFLMSEQKNVSEMQKCIKSIFREKFHSNDEKATCYMAFFDKVRKSYYTNNRITREEVILNLAKLLISGFVTTPPILRKPSHKIEIVERAVKLFDVTILKNVGKEVIHKWQNVLLHDSSELEHLAKKLKFIEKNDSLSEEILAQIVAYIIEKPLFLQLKKKFEKTIIAVVDLLQNLKNSKVHVVLFGRNTKDGHFEDVKNFQNLEDLLVDENLYKDLTKTFRVSLQGRKAESLENLKQEFGINLDRLITPSEMFHCLEEDLVIGKKLDELPEFYISRTLLKAELSVPYLKEICRTETAIVHCSGKSSKFEQFLQEEGFDFKIEHRSSYKQKNEKGILILTDEEMEDFEENKKSRFKHLRLANDDSFKWLEIEVDSQNLSSLYQNHLNVVCGNSGIGKTTVMKYLAHQCPLQYWVVTIPMQQMDLFFETEDATRSILNQFLYQGQQKELDRRVCDHLLETKQILFMFDGLNELHANSINKAVDVIKQVMNEGYKVWVFCTPTYKELLESHLGPPCYYEIGGITLTDQENYVSKRLNQGKVQKSLIEQIKELLFDTDKEKFKDILKIPLLLYVLTDILNNQKDLESLKKDFTIYQIFSRFIEERLKHYLKKKQCSNFKAITEIIEGFKNYYFDNYQIAALQTCLEKDSFLLLNIKNDRRFIYYLQKNDDFLGFVKLSNNNSFTFVHHSFAKYFVASWLSQNFDIAPDEIKKMLLTSGFYGIRRFFDANLAEGCPLHLAVLDQDMSRVKKYAESCVKDTDKGGRTALHLAASIGRTYPVLERSYNPQNVISRSSGTEEEILDYLLTIFESEEILKKDNLLGWNSLEYADASSCIISLEKLSTKVEMSLEYLKTNYKDLFTLTFYCVTLSCMSLLKSAINFYGLPKLEEEHKENLLFLALKHNNNEVASLLLENGIKIPESDSQKILLFYEAINCGHVEVVELLLKQNISLEAKDEFGRSPLMIASRKGHTNIVKLLVERGALVDGSDQDQKVPLLKAAHMGRTEVVEFLIDQGANLDSVNSWKKNALHLAAEMGHLSTVKCLVEKGADKNSVDRYRKTALHLAAYGGHKAVVQYLIKKNFDIFAKDEDNRTAREIAEVRGYRGIVKVLSEANEILSDNNKRDPSYENYETFFHRASFSGDLEGIMLELEKGTDVNEISTDKDTALHIAARQGHLHIVEYLLSKGANTAAANVDGRVPLHLACQKGHFAIVKMLLNRGQNDAGDNWGIKPIHRAVYEGHLDVVKLLIDSKVDVNSPAGNFLTPLHSAALGGRVDILEYLLSVNGDIRRKTNKDETCLHYAAMNGWTKVVDYLIKRYEDIVDVVTCYDKTALHLAAEQGYEETVQVLVEGGADVKLRDSDRKTALDIAVNTNRKSIVKLLEKYQDK